MLTMMRTFSHPFPKNNKTDTINGEKGDYIPKGKNTSVEMSFIKLLTETVNFQIDSIFSQCSQHSHEDSHVYGAFFI